MSLPKQEKKVCLNEVAKFYVQLVCFVYYHFDILMDFVLQSGKI